MNINTDEIVAINAYLYRAGEQVIDHLIENDHSGDDALWIVNSEYVTDLAPFAEVVPEDEHSLPFDYTMYTLTADILRVSFRAVGASHGLGEASGYLDMALVNAGPEEVFEGFEAEIAALVMPHCHDEPVTVLTLWRYYGEVTYSEDGNDYDEEWELLGEIDGAKLRDTLTVAVPKGGA